MADGEVDVGRLYGGYRVNLHGKQRRLKIEQFVSC
jgi:hypothetical protein